MSRGDRVTTAGNLSHSMRDNYNEHGVGEYYKKVGSIYRNPHFPGVRHCLFTWLDKWWKFSAESAELPGELLFFDMACGTGEATTVFIEWCQMGRRLYELSRTEGRDAVAVPSNQNLPIPKRRALLAAPALGPQFPIPKVIATDPYTSAAFVERTGLPCSSFSFHDIAEGSLPGDVSYIFPSQAPEGQMQRADDVDSSSGMPVVEMVVCSFALHLVESPSELFSLLWELSTKARWLVVLAPHKKPEIKEGWGWSKWNVDTWSEASMNDHAGEILHERVHCRAYRSMNF
ncbi:hypothetical protein WG66_014943 [Moniliophthora roreri]|nr:hypothetical protein WG66_014943 [Moniliophthora roreri]